jgi:hypothetical protein
MRILLGQQLGGSVIHIALGPDRLYHVLWCGESLASAATISGAISRASAGPLTRPGVSVSPSYLAVSADPARWVVWSSPEPSARSADAPLRKEPPRSLRTPSPAIRKVARVGAKANGLPVVAS